MDMFKKILLILISVFLSSGCATTPANSTSHDEASKFTKEGNQYLLQGEFEQAIAAYQKAIELNPNDTEAYLNRGQAYAIGSGQYDLAIADYNKVIKINPRDAQAYFKRGKVYKQKGEFDRAISDYSKAIELNPNYAEAYTNRGVIYGRDKGQFDLAISDFNKAIEVNPQLLEAYLNKASACENSGQTEEAINAYKGFLQHATPQLNDYITYAEKRIKELQK